MGVWSTTCKTETAETRGAEYHMRIVVEKHSTTPAYSVEFRTVWLKLHLVAKPDYIESLASVHIAVAEWLGEIFPIGGRSGCLKFRKTHTNEVKHPPL